MLPYYTCVAKAWPFSNYCLNYFIVSILKSSILLRRIGTLSGRPAAVPPPLKIIQNFGNKQDGKRKQTKRPALAFHAIPEACRHGTEACHTLLCLLTLWMTDPNKHVFVAISTGDTMFCST